MSDHPDLRPLIDAVDPPVSERRAILAHLKDCPACRGELAAADPSLLFSLLALEPVPAEVLDRVSERAAMAISLEKQRSASPGGQLWRVLAASVLVAALGGAYLWSTGDRHEPPSGGLERVEIHELPISEPAIPAGMIELLDSSGISAEVVELAVGDVHFVMIFDEAMEI